MNRLPWFTHDHSAHRDLWIRHLIKKGGHTAGWMWWVLLELLHEHGTGDTLIIPVQDLAHAVGTQPYTAIKILKIMASECSNTPANTPANSPATVLRVSYKSVGGVLEIKIPKFRERQSKLKSKTPAKLLQDYRRTPSTRRKKKINFFRGGGTPPPAAKNGYQTDLRGYCVICQCAHPGSPCPPELLEIIRQEKLARK